jgi:sporulation protein YlmC with PRC-barrel domain
MTVFHLHHFLASAAVAVSFLPAQAAPSEPATPSPAAAAQRLSARCRASQLIGLAITNSKNENLGEIQDIVLDSANTRIAYAVVGFGGFLGMGEKYFAMPWRVLEISQRSSEDTPRATLGLDRETLKAAPGFDRANWPDMANPSWAGQVDDYYRARHEAAPAVGATEPKGSAVDGSRGIDRKPGSSGFVHRRLSHLIGMDVVDAKRMKLAAVEDLIVDTRGAVVDAFVLSYGGTLGIGEHTWTAPWCHAPDRTRLHSGRSCRCAAPPG